MVLLSSGLLLPNGKQIYLKKKSLLVQKEIKIKINLSFNESF